MRLSDFSREVFREILSYLEVPLDLGRLSCVCKTIQSGIRDDRHLWERAYGDRWGGCSLLSHEHASQSEVPDCSLWRYKERHIQDNQVLRTLQGLQGVEIFLAGRHIRVDVERNHYQMLVSVIRYHRRGKRNNKDASKLYPLPQKISSTEQWLAWCAFRSVQHFKAKVDVLDLFEDLNTSKLTSATEIMTLERGASWLSEFLMNAEDIAQANYWPYQIDCRVRTLLDNLTNKLSSKLMRRNAWTHRGEPNSVTDAVKFVAAEIDFSGNESQYYNEKNSSIAHVLETRMGIPITLSVAFKLLLHRLGYAVDIIGLPGHVVLGVPDGDSTVFLDVFNGCKVLSVSDCRNIATSSGVEWSSAFLEPLSALAVLGRMLRNVLFCRVMALTSNRSSENMDSVVKIRDLYDFFQSASTHHNEGSAEWITTFRQRISQPHDFILDGRSLDFFRTLEQRRRRSASF